jgi:hypothetical protein
MSVCARIFCLLLAALAFARAAEREVTKKFAVEPGCTLRIDSYRGQITVEESEANEVGLALLMETGVDAEKELGRIFGTLELDVKQDGNTVAIRARNPSQTRVSFSWQEPERIDLTYRVTVPRRCNVELVLGRGSVTVGNLAGRHRARVEKGDIFFRRIEGSIDARTQAGDVIVSRCSGAVTLRAAQGIIRVGTIGGWADLQNDSGDIEVLVARGGIVASAAMGDITVGFPDVLAAENRVTTSSGNVFAKFSPKSDGTVVAAAPWNRVESKLPLTVESGAVGKSKLTARLNAGGPRVTLHAEGGLVKILPRDYELE